jgi:hypothetical protein
MAAKIGFCASVWSYFPNKTPQTVSFCKKIWETRQIFSLLQPNSEKQLSSWPKFVKLQAKERG